MNYQASPALQSKLTGCGTNVPAFDGVAIKVGGDTLARWKRAYRFIEDRPSVLQAVDDYCAAMPADNPKQISRASSWLERRNSRQRSETNELSRLDEICPPEIYGALL